jgi:hypothetical protein
MDSLPFTLTDDGRFHIDAYPEAVKAVGLTGDHAERLAHLLLHTQDLTFAHDCVATLQITPDKLRVVREALWRAGVIAWSKCFSKSHAGRFRLTRDEIYDEGIPRDVFAYFIALRNKHFAHDENAFAQAVPGAVIGPPGGEQKVLDVLCLRMHVATASADADINNFGLLVETALQWVSAEYDMVVNTIRDDLEQCTYEELLALPSMVVHPPNAEDAASRRTSRQ